MAKKAKKKALDPAAAAAAEAAARRDEQLLQLQIEATSLRELCEREDKDFQHFLLEREKINYFWIVEKKTLTEKQADLRNKERELQDRKERQDIELKMFQQRLKHLRYHHTNEIVELKTDAELALKLQEDHHRVTEAEIQKDKRALKVQMKEAEVSQEDFVRMLKLENDQQILELRQEFDRKARDLQQKYELRMKTIREHMEKTRQNQIRKIEEDKNAHIHEVMTRNQKAFHDIKVYYTEITSSNLDSIVRLKEEHSDIKKTENKEAKKMFDLEQRNKQLKEPLKNAHQEVESLQAKKQAYEEDKKKLAEVKEKIKHAETNLHRLEFQHEVLQQQLATANKEWEELYAKFQHAIYDVQRKSGLKNLILEKKLDAVEEALETTAAQVAEILASAKVEQATSAGISQKLEQVIAYKNDIVVQLQEEVHRIKDSHHTMVRTYESKLMEYGIPPEELGFTPNVE
eukprot:TRINITY_DN75592_c0_g1_i1.p1 TRINITY_DN75592_c0_g1~~TRINITY_DN75592_c0_g1_i1.p1  ORF type:complete len:482 (-),score=151.06 TRINITY_DN75592_c0_g1_i1:40-1419(-)